MEPLLLLADFKEFFEAPDTMPINRLYPHVVEVQRQQLALLTGRPLLAALGTAVKQARADAYAAQNGSQANWPGYLPAVWADLWGGTTALGGVKQFLAYASWARFLPFSPFTMSSHSFVQKTSDQSTAASQGAIAAQVTTLLDTAQSYQAELQRLLVAMSTELAQWLPAQNPCQVGPAAPQGTITLIGIRRPM